MLKHFLITTESSKCCDVPIFYYSHRPWTRAPKTLKLPIALPKYFPVGIYSLFPNIYNMLFAVDIVPLLIFFYSHQHRTRSHTTRTLSIIVYKCCPVGVSQHMQCHIVHCWHRTTPHFLLLWSTPDEAPYSSYTSSTLQDIIIQTEERARVSRLVGKDLLRPWRHTCHLHCESRILARSLVVHCEWKNPYTKPSSPDDPVYYFPLFSRIQLYRPIYIALSHMRKCPICTDTCI
jgi:hypothetical protein